MGTESAGPSFEAKIVGILACTAIVIAFLELKCHAERDFWEMSVERARTVVPDLEFIEKAKKFITEL